jgi:diaminopimelate epimerase
MGLTLMKLPFFKYHGAGNDFIIFPEDLSYLDSLQIASLCHRKYGIGADGLIFLQKPSIASSDYRMRYFNADGKEAALCGNGLRCVIDYISKNLCHQENYRIQTEIGEIFCSLQKEGIAIHHPTRFLKRNLSFPFESEILEGNLIDSGVPHLIFFTSSLKSENFPAFAATISSQFPEEVNVSFAHFLLPSTLYLRTWERGVGETLACGTAAAATAFAIDQHQSCPFLKIIPSSHESLFTTVISSQTISVCGKASFVFQGEVIPNVIQRSRL